VVVLHVIDAHPLYIIIILYSILYPLPLSPTLPPKVWRQKTFYNLHLLMYNKDVKDVIHKIVVYWWIVGVWK